MLKPVFIENGDVCTFSGYAHNAETGELFAGVPANLPTQYNGGILRLPNMLKCNVVESWGAVSMPREKLQSIIDKNAAKATATTQPQTTQPHSHKMQNNTYTAFENATGKMSQVGREESPLGATGTGEILNLVINNPTGTGAAAQVLLGDGSGVLAQKLALPALPGGVTFGGNYGAQTLAVYNNMVKAGKWIKFKGNANFQALTNPGGASGQLLFSQGTTLQVVAQNDVIGSMLQQQPYNFMINYSGNQLDTSVRLAYNFVYTISDVTALYFQIPEGYTFSMSAEILSSRTASIMGLSN